MRYFQLSLRTMFVCAMLGLVSINAACSPDKNPSPLIDRAQTSEEPKAGRGPTPERPRADMWVTEVNWSLDADEKFTYFDKQAEYDSRMAVLYRADWSGVVAIVKVSVEVGAVQPVIQLMINPTVPDQENINKGARQIELTVVTKDEQVVVVGTGISLRLVPPLKKASGKALIYLPSPFAVWTP